MQGDESLKNEVQYDEEGKKILNIGTLTALQQLEAKQAREAHRENMIKKQPGFKGEKAFIAKPSQIAFPDFTVGKAHYLVLTLTNVSNAFNSFNILPLPQKIRNYFQIEYVPKGKISPGITSDIRFKFFPQLNQDIYSEFTIIAETGKITYPIICTSKKTIVKCDNNLVNFGKIIFGQSGKAKLTVRNQGSLPSQIILQNPNGSEIGKGNTEQEMQFINHLKFQRKSQIGGNCEKILNFELKPVKIGFFKLTLFLYIKNILHSPPIRVDFEAECVQVPVRIERQLYDFEICLLNHIYREKLVFYNNGQMPMSFKMVQSNETKKYFEFNPIIGYIQKQSKIDIWIKFSAEKDLNVYLSKYMVEKNVYVIPFHMAVKQQILPVTFDVKFKITSQKVNIRPADLNFGSIFQGLSSKIEVQFENQSELPQQILMYPLKKQISVQNDQPLLKILPRETIKTFITYKSKKLQENGKIMKEQGSIPCKIITGDIATTEVKLDYVCEIVRPDLCITNNKIDLPVVQIDEVTQASTILKNNANKEILYELFVPSFQISGLKITPVVKSLPPKQQVEINIEYHSSFKKLTPALMREIELKANHVQKPILQKKEPEAVVDKKQPPKKDAKKQTKLTKQQQEALELEQKRLQEEQRLKKEQQEQERLQAERNFDAEAQLTKMGGKFYDFGDAQHYKWLLPVYFKQKDFPDASVEINYLQVTTTSSTKTLVSDKTEIDFGQIAVGTRSVKQINILNKGQTAQLKKRSLPIFCSFNVLNSMKQVQQNKVFKAVIQFQPIQEQRFQQKLEFYTDKYIVSCMLKGKGVRPEVCIEPESGLINMGGVLLDEYSQKTVKIKNICNFQINFVLNRVGRGISNSNSSRAISYIPSYGVIGPNSSIQVKIKFKPDRIGEKYFEKVRVHVQQQKIIKNFYVTGACYPRQAYVCDFKESIMPEDSDVSKKVESAFDWLKIKDQNTIYGPNNKSIILEYTRLTEHNRDNQKCFKRKIVIGSCKLLDNKMEKPTNFQIIMPKDDRFQCDNLKGAVSPGAETIATFTFKPEQTDPLISKIPILVGVGQWKDIKVELKFSGGFIKPGGVDALSFDIILRVYVNQL